MKVFNIALLAIFVLLVILISHWLGQNSYSWLPAPASLEAGPVGDLTSFLVTMGSVVFLAVFGVLLYSLLFFRAGKNDQTDGTLIRGNSKIEITWTIIPILLVTWITIYSFHIYKKMDLLGHISVAQIHEHNLFDQSADAAEIDTKIPTSETIEVIAKQWSWSFNYSGQNVNSTELHLPVNEKAHLLLKSEDVLHGFYVPNFRIKQDIVPNRTIDFSFTPNKMGKYKLHDSQFSGTYFALMDAEVYVESREDYEKWLAQTASLKPIAAKNKAFIEHNKMMQYASWFRWPTISPAKPPLVNSLP